MGHYAAQSTSCLVGGAENSGPCRSSSGGAGEEELRAGAGQAGERAAEPGETRPGGQGLRTLQAGGRLRGNVGQPQTGPGEQGGGAQSQTTVSVILLLFLTLQTVSLLSWCKFVSLLVS